MTYQWFTSGNGITWTLVSTGNDDTFVAVASCNAGDLLFVRVIVTDINGSTAIATSSGILVTDNENACNRGSIGSNQDEDESEDVKRFNLRVSPNPLESVTNVTFTLATETSATIELSDNLGKVHKNMSLGILTNGTHQYQLDCTSLPSGLYTLRVYTGTGITRSRLINIAK